MLQRPERLNAKLGVRRVCVLTKGGENVGGNNGLDLLVHSLMWQKDGRTNLFHWTEIQG